MKIDSRDDLLVCKRNEILPEALPFFSTGIEGLMKYDETSHKYHVNKEMAGYFELLYGTLEFENVVMIFDCRPYLSRFFRGMAREFWPHEELISDNLDQIFDGYEDLRGKLDKLADYQHCLANLMPAPAGFAQSRMFDGKGNRNRDNDMPDIYYDRAKSDLPHMRQWIDDNMEKYSLQIFCEYESCCEDGSADEPVTDDPVELVPFERSIDNAIACIEYRAMKMINRFHKRHFKGYSSKEWLLNGDICYI